MCGCSTMMPLGLFACRHAAAADGGRWTPVLRLGGSRSLASIAHRAVGGPCRRTSRRKIGKRSAACISNRAHTHDGTAAAAIRHSSCRGVSSGSGSSDSEIDTERDAIAQEHDNEERDVHCCRCARRKRVRQLAAGNPFRSGSSWNDHLCNACFYACNSSASPFDDTCGETWRGGDKASSEDVVRCRFSPNGSYLAACTSNGGLRVYEVETGQQVCNIPYAHAGGINDICWHHSSGYIFTASSDGSAALFPLAMRSAAGAARRLLRNSLGRRPAAPGGVMSNLSYAHLPLHVENAVAPVLEFFPRGALGAGPATGYPSCTSGGAGRGSCGTGSSVGSTASSGAAAAGGGTRHRGVSSNQNIGGGIVVAPVTCVAAPQNSSAASSAHCMYTGSYDEFLRTWDMRAPRGPLLQVRAHDGPLTSLDFAEASPLLLPPYIPFRPSASNSSRQRFHSSSTHASQNGVPCGYCPSLQSLSCQHDWCCCCDSGNTGSFYGKRRHSLQGKEEYHHRVCSRCGLLTASCVDAAETAIADASASLFDNSCREVHVPVSSAAEAADIVTLPDMLASASVDGLVRLWQAPALKLLRTTRSGRGGWEGGSSGATAASPSAAASTTTHPGSISINHVGCGWSPAAAAAAATAGCCHVTWSRSGDFLLCLYEQGLGGGTLLRLRTLQQPHMASRVLLRRQREQVRKQQRDSRGTKRTADGRAVASGGGDGEHQQHLGGLNGEAAQHSEEEEEEDVAAEEEKWWGQETCMPLSVPFMWDDTVQKELLQSASDASWHPRISRRKHRDSCRAPAAGPLSHIKDASPISSDDDMHNEAARAASGGDVYSAHMREKQSVFANVNTATDVSLRVAGATHYSCAAGAGGFENEFVSAPAATAGPARTTPTHTLWGEEGSAAFLHALLCRKDKIFSPFGTFWRDCAVLPATDGCVRVFDALRGKLLHTLIPAADISASSGNAVCTSVDAHPDWSVGVLASSCSAPDGAIVLWLWERDDGEDRN